MQHILLVYKGNKTTFDLENEADDYKQVIFFYFFKSCI